MTTKERLTIGEVAKEMCVTVRTLQYYDKEKLLTPSARSEGGRRLYTKKDMVKLHQILSLKYLGFSLDEIKNNLLNLDTPQQVLLFLEQQTLILKEQKEALELSLDAIEALKHEVKMMDTVNFERYADIISLLKHDNKDYWMIKLFDDKLMNQMKHKYQNEPEKGVAFYEQYKAICDETIALQDKGVLPSSKEGLELAKTWWSMITEFTGGDMSLLPSLMKFNDNKHGWDEELKRKQEMIDGFINQALGMYFEIHGIEIPELEA